MNHWKFWLVIACSFSFIVVFQNCSQAPSGSMGESANASLSAEGLDLPASLELPSSENK